MESDMKWESAGVIGRGGSSTVFRARLLASGTFVAVKQMETDGMSKESIAAITGEIETMRMLLHPNIIQYLGMQQNPHKIYILMEYADRGSLRVLYQKIGRLSEPQIAHCLKQILRGLSYLHSQGIAHRDVKCANALLCGESDVKLADFGASKKFENESLVSGLKGTPHWMAPEVIKGSQLTDGWMKADTWSLGCTVVEMFTARVPYAEYENPMTAMYRIAGGEVPSLVIKPIVGNGAGTAKSGHPEGSAASEVDDSSQKRLSPGVSNVASAELESFVASCCSLNPDERPTCSVLLDHPFLLKPYDLTLPFFQYDPEGNLFEGTGNEHGGASLDDGVEFADNDQYYLSPRHSVGGDSEEERHAGADDVVMGDHAGDASDIDIDRADQPQPNMKVVSIVSVRKGIESSAIKIDTEEGNNGAADNPYYQDCDRDLATPALFQADKMNKIMSHSEFMHPTSRSNMRSSEGVITPHQVIQQKPGDFLSPQARQQMNSCSTSKEELALDPPEKVVEGEGNSTDENASAVELGEETPTIGGIDFMQFVIDPSTSKSQQQPEQLQPTTSAFSKIIGDESHAGAKARQKRGSKENSSMFDTMLTAYNTRMNDAARSGGHKFSIVDALQEDGAMDSSLQVAIKQAQEDHQRRQSKNYEKSMHKNADDDEDDYSSEEFEVGEDIVSLNTSGGAGPKAEIQNQKMGASGGFVSVGNGSESSSAVAVRPSAPLTSEMLRLHAARDSIPVSAAEALRKRSENGSAAIRQGAYKLLQECSLGNSGGKPIGKKPLMPAKSVGVVAGGVGGAIANNAEFHMGSCGNVNTSSPYTKGSTVLAHRVRKPAGVQGKTSQRMQKLKPLVTNIQIDRQNQILGNNYSSSTLSRNSTNSSIVEQQVFGDAGNLASLNEQHEQLSGSGQYRSKSANYDQSSLNARGGPGGMRLPPVAGSGGGSSAARGAEGSMSATKQQQLQHQQGGLDGSDGFRFIQSAPPVSRIDKLPSLTRAQPRQGQNGVPEGSLPRVIVKQTGAGKMIGANGSPPARRNKQPRLNK